MTLPSASAPQRRDPAWLGRVFAIMATLATRTLSVSALTGPMAALRVRGVREVLVFCYADLPTALPQMVSYTLYRWENNIRAAAVLGVVGAASWRRDCWYSAVGYFSRSAETEAVEAKFLGKKS
jgi:hypothetical protein